MREAGAASILALLRVQHEPRPSAPRSRVRHVQENSLQRMRDMACRWVPQMHQLSCRRRVQFAGDGDSCASAVHSSGWTDRLRSEAVQSGARRPDHGHHLRPFSDQSCQGRVRPRSVCRLVKVLELIQGAHLGKDQPAAEGQQAHADPRRDSPGNECPQASRLQISQAYPITGKIRLHP